MRKVMGERVKRPPAPAQLTGGPLPSPPKGNERGERGSRPLPFSAQPGDHTRVPAPTAPHPTAGGQLG